MSKTELVNKSRQFLQLLLAVNFIASLIFLLLISAFTLLGSHLIFEDQTELYGPMASNLRLMLVYLCLTELSVFSFCRFSHAYQGLLLLGIFLVLLAVSIEFYGDINEVPVDEYYRWFFLYLGISHVAYAMVAPAKPKLQTD